MHGVNVYFLSAVFGILVGVSILMGFLLDRHKKSIQECVTAAVAPIETRLTVIETKIEIFWREVGFSAARGLHHPEPSRAAVDDLLDKYLEGHLSASDTEELKGYLEIIKSWRPGKPAPFKIFTGEQVHAAILLYSIDHDPSLLKETR